VTISGVEGRGLALVLGRVRVGCPSTHVPIRHPERKEVEAMATYSLEALQNRWARGELDVEQMLGHILQHLLRLEREYRILKDLLLACAQRLKDQRG
jgi:hypothetical protein